LYAQTAAVSAAGASSDLLCDVINPVHHVVRFTRDVVDSIRFSSATFSSIVTAIDRIIVLRATEASAMTFEIFSPHISLSSLREASLFGLSFLAVANSHMYMQ
jgi:hypothetical protein